MIQEGVSDTFQNSENASDVTLKRVDTPHLGYQNTPCICTEHGCGDMGRLISGTYVHPDLIPSPNQSHIRF